jgi:hypothetical protein
MGIYIYIIFPEQIAGHLIASRHCGVGSHFRLPVYRGVYILIYQCITIMEVDLYRDEGDRMWFV